MVANAKMWFLFLQTVFVVQSQVEGIKVKREPYSVQESSQEFSSGGGDISGYGGFSSDSGTTVIIKGGGGFGSGSGGLYASHIGGGGGLSSFVLHGGSGGSIGSYGSYGPTINEGPHLISGGKSISDLQDEAHSKIKTLLLESKINQKLAEDKVEKMRKNFGYGTFGYQGYEYPIKPGPIDLGTHHAVDLGTSLDSNSIKDGKIKLPVQTVYITKTVGVPIPEPFPIKHEVPVPAPYPVPVPSHYSGESYPSSYSSDYSGDSGDSGDSGKSSYQDSASTLSKVVSYHENLPKSTEKNYASASTKYFRYLPVHSSSAYSTALTPTHYSPKQSVYEFK